MKKYERHIFILVSESASNTIQWWNILFCFCRHDTVCLLWFAKTIQFANYKFLFVRWTIREVYFFLFPESLKIKQMNACKNKTPAKSRPLCVFVIKIDIKIAYVLYEMLKTLHIANYKLLYTRWKNIRCIFIKSLSGE